MPITTFGGFEVSAELCCALVNQLKNKHNIIDKPIPTCFIIQKNLVAKVAKRFVSNKENGLQRLNVFDVM
jgi:hypothetical protein